MWTVELRLALLILATYTLLILLLGRWSARREARRARSALERIPLGFLRLLPDGRYVEANSIARQLLSLPAASGRLPEARWRPWLEEDMQAARAEWAGRSRLVAMGEGNALQWWVAPEGEEFWLFVADAGEGYRGLQMLRRWLAGLAHELRTPLATMLTHLEVLKLPSIAPEIRAQSLEILEAEARRMLRMAHGVLELGRLAGEPPVLRPLDLTEVVRAAVAEKLPEAQARRQTLTVEIEQGLPMAVGEADRLKQVFLNLLDNAIRYSRPGDRIAVTLRRVPAGIQCAVEDTGPGIPEAHLPYVTEPFYRGDVGESGGSGLGLAIVAEILRQHQARLEIESPTEGETGTAVRFTLPVWEEGG
ncbi:sensor histidine kinase [Thermoflexus sp.]|uniref:sensor histidine kinase n=1 Tax=Thermoflexus sp. TaxID=1969742 RepID=UPI002ADD6D1A|nr:ATP-binding protein [Thermoflexus sp.]